MIKQKKKEKQMNEKSKKIERKAKRNKMDNGK